MSFEEYRKAEDQCMARELAEQIIAPFERACRVTEH
jgi:hypothetical protein